MSEKLIDSSVLLVQIKSIYSIFLDRSVIGTDRECSTWAISNASLPVHCLYIVCCILVLQMFENKNLNKIRLAQFEQDSAPGHASSLSAIQ